MIILRRTEDCLSGEIDNTKKYTDTTMSFKEHGDASKQYNMSYVNSLSMDSAQNKHLEKKGDSINIQIEPKPKQVSNDLTYDFLRKKIRAHMEQKPDRQNDFLQQIAYQDHFQNQQFETVNPELTAKPARLDKVLDDHKVYLEKKQKKVTLNSERNSAQKSHALSQLQKSKARRKQRNGKKLFRTDHTADFSGRSRSSSRGRVRSLSQKSKSRTFQASEPPKVPGPYDVAHQCQDDLALSAIYQDLLRSEQKQFKALMK